MKNSRSTSSNNRKNKFTEELSFRFSTGSDSGAGRRDVPYPTMLGHYNSNNDAAEGRASWEPSPWDESPFSGSSFEQPSSPLSRSPWHSTTAAAAPPSSNGFDCYSYTGLMGSLVREEGHIYSLAALGDLLYTGSDSKNIRVWKNQKEYTGFKSNSGLVKAIIIAGDRIFTGHQDGKIRVWKVSSKNPSVHKRIGTLPTFKACIKKSIKPSNYVEVRKNHNAVWIKHFDAISSLTLSEDSTLLYSSSWDKTIKVWRIEDSKCLESISAHDDAVNSVVVGLDGLVFSGSADGTVKVWRREFKGKGTKHVLSQTLIKLECAVTSLVIDPTSTRLYGGSSDGQVNFWESTIESTFSDVPKSQLLRHGGVLRGHKLAVLCLAAAGTLVFSGSADTNICVWRRDAAGDHICLSVLNGHSGPVKCLAVEEEIGSAACGSADKTWVLYSGSLDKSVKIWRVSSQLPRLQPLSPQAAAGGLTSPSAAAGTPSFSKQGSRIHQQRSNRHEW